MEKEMASTSSKVYKPLTLPASNLEVYNGAIQPAYSYLRPGLASPEATCQLLAIGKQESGFRTRQQYGNGPAHGLWMFEGGGVRDTLYSTRSGNLLWNFCQDIGVQYGSITIYDALLSDDLLAAGLARLLLWDDLSPLPRIGDIEDAWQCYIRCWNPGKPNRTRWSLAYAQAVDTMKELA